MFEWKKVWIWDKADEGRIARGMASENKSFMTSITDFNSLKLSFKIEFRTQKKLLERNGELLI